MNTRYPASTARPDDGQQPVKGVGTVSNTRQSEPKTAMQNYSPIYRTVFGFQARYVGEPVLTDEVLDRMTREYWNIADAEPRNLFLIDMLGAVLEELKRTKNFDR